MKIQLLYLTSQGCEWLKEEFDVTPENLRETVTNYIDKTKELAGRLVAGWILNGEVEEYLFPVTNCEDNSMVEMSDKILDEICSKDFLAIPVKF